MSAECKTIKPPPRLKYIAYPFRLVTETYAISGTLNDRKAEHDLHGTLEEGKYLFMHPSSADYLVSHLEEECMRIDHIHHPVFWENEINVKELRLVWVHLCSKMDAILVIASIGDHLRLLKWTCQAYIVSDIKQVIIRTYNQIRRPRSNGPHQLYLSWLVAELRDYLLGYVWSLHFIPLHLTYIIWQPMCLNESFCDCNSVSYNLELFHVFAIELQTRADFLVYQLCRATSISLITMTDGP